MKFLARYIPIRPGSNSNHYYLTVDGDNVNEATKKAKKMASKGFRLILLYEQQGRD